MRRARAWSGRGCARPDIRARRSARSAPSAAVRADRAGPPPGRVRARRSADAGSDRPVMRPMARPVACRGQRGSLTRSFGAEAPRTDMPGSENLRLTSSQIRVSNSSRPVKIDPPPILDRLALAARCPSSDWLQRHAVSAAALALDCVRGAEHRAGGVQRLHGHVGLGAGRGDRRLEAALRRRSPPV